MIDEIPNNSRIEASNMEILLSKKEIRSEKTKKLALQDSSEESIKDSESEVENFV